MFNSRTTAYINEKNILDNLQTVKNKLLPDTKVMAVLKANAYGHGAKICTEILKDKVDAFAVSNIDEALEIRKSEPFKDIFILGFTHPSYATILCKNNITQALVGEDFARELSKYCVKQGVSVKCHIALDTGMGRIGFKDAQTAAECAKLEGINTFGAFTHFACADMTDERSRQITKGQFELFLSLCRQIKQYGIDLKIRHCANSAAIFNYPEYQLDMVRAGIVLYGLAPNANETDLFKDLKPALKICSLVSHIKWIKKGESIGYGSEFTAIRETRVATVPCGYADGYYRSLKDGFVLINGKKAKILGKICMDQLMVDVTNIEDAGFMSEVVLLGCDGDEKITAEQLSLLDGTINYQLVCSVSSRVTRKKC